MATSGRQDGGPQAGLSAGLDVSDDIKSAWAEVRDDNAPTSWLYATLDHKSKPPRLGLREKGSTEESFFAAFQKAEVNWAGVRVHNKFFGICCPGTEVPAMAKSKQVMFKNAVMNSLDGCSGDFRCEDLEELKAKISELGQAG
eukprot:TRINITY_DN51799_c0_g1_i1.p1 TRINITY_DN51799_c0_g1~~TRINITY_DN51799_c0_g1_i1.p1  ORF type:complete len:143 (+),score=28.54 TRINITY_DN51799_c0_g1_i1:161-589(+)